MNWFKKEKKLCLDCKHCTMHYGSYLCKSPKNSKECVVTGKNIPKFEYCESMRSPGEDCGPNAKWFERKEK